MRATRIVVLCLALSACAVSRQPLLPDCPAEMGAERGSKDARQGRLPSETFAAACSLESREAVLGSYRSSYSSALPKPKHAQLEVKPVSLVDMPATIAPASVTWMCEVEANSKVFTGVGPTRDEALVSAQSTCDSHFAADTCRKAECKQNL